MRIDGNFNERHLKEHHGGKIKSYRTCLFGKKMKKKGIIYCPLSRFFKALARTPAKICIVSLFERNSGKSD
jgi:hypothetical protein